MLKAARRLLSPNGYLVIATDNFDCLVANIGVALYRASGGRVRYPIERVFIDRNRTYFTQQSLLALLARLGWRVVDPDKMEYPLRKIRTTRLERAVLATIYAAAHVTRRQAQLTLFAVGRMSNAGPALVVPDSSRTCAIADGGQPRAHLVVAILSLAERPLASAHDPDAARILEPCVQLRRLLRAQLSRDPSPRTHGGGLPARLCLAPARRTQGRHQPLRTAAARERILVSRDGESRPHRVRVRRLPVDPQRSTLPRLSRLRAGYSVRPARADGTGCAIAIR